MKNQRKRSKPFSNAKKPKPPLLCWRRFKWPWQNVLVENIPLKIFPVHDTMYKSFESPEEGAVSKREWILKWKNVIDAVSRKVSHDQIPVYGAQASFFIIVSAVPFAMALLSLIQFFIPAEWKEALSYLLGILPESVSRAATAALNDIYTKAASSIVSVSVVVAVWSASKGVMALERCLHVIYQVEEKRNFIFRRLRSVLYTLFFLMVIVITLGLLVFGNAIQSALTAHIPFLGRIEFIIFGLRSLLSTATFLAAFSAVYMVLSGARRRFLQVLPGVLFSTVGWTLFSLIYAYYITNFSNYTYLYGSLGAIILMMLWLYSCIIILLAGAELNVFLECQFSHKDPDSPAGSPKHALPAEGPDPEPEPEGESQK